MIFLSHSSVDKPFVRFIASEIALSGHQFWLDEKDIRLGEVLASTLKAAVATSAQMLLFVSPSSLQSRWVEQEIEYAESLNAVGRKAPYIPCLMGALTDQEVPDKISARLYLDFRNPTGYDKSMVRLLTDLSPSSERARLPVLDSERSDHLIQVGSEQSMRIWILTYLTATLSGRTDETERYWSYIVLGTLGGPAEYELLAHAQESDSGFAKRGAQDGLEVLSERGIQA